MLQLLLGMLLLLPLLLLLLLLPLLLPPLPLLLLSPRTGSKLLLQGIHLAVKQVPIPLYHPPHLQDHMGLALRDLKLAAQGFQLLVALLRLLLLLLLLLLLHQMGDVGVHGGFLWSWGACLGDFPWPSRSTWSAAPPPLTPPR